MNGLTFEPDIPLALWLPLALVAGGLLAAYALGSRGRLRGRSRLAVLVFMSLALALPLLILLNPTWVEPIPPPAGKPHLTMLIDTSASMAIMDGQGGVSRYGEALEIAGKMTRALSDVFDIRVRSVSEDSVPRDLVTLGQQQPEGVLTDLAAGVEQSLDDRPQGQAVMLLSDGIHNAGGGLSALRQSLAKAHAMAAPVYVKTMGEQSGVRDLEVILRLPQEMAFTGQTVPVVVSVHQRGTLVDRTQLTLSLQETTDLQGTTALQDNIVQQQELRLAPDGVSEATFSIVQQDSGLYRYEIRAAVEPGEVTDVNNSATLLLRVVDEPVRVLLLEGRPYWDTKFLARTLAADPSVDLTTVIRMAEGRFLQRHISRVQEGEDPLATESAGQGPVSAERWTTEFDLEGLFSGATGLNSYQVVLLGRDAEVFLNDSRVAQLKKWLVEESGCLVCFRGSPATQVSQQMAELMPIRWTPTRESRFRVQLTPSGRAVQWLPTLIDGQELLSNLPSLATVSQPQQPKPLTVVLATAEMAGQKATPVISYQPIGNGRVVVVEGAGMWRWAFLPPEHQQFDETYGMLWRSLVRWLVANSGLLPSQQVALRSDKVTFSSAETATATLLMRETGPEGPPAIELTGGSMDSPQRIAPVAAGSWPGHFRAVFGKLPEGRYRARVIGESDESASTAAFDVRGNLAERLEVAARPDLMRMIAQESGGAVLEDDLARQLARQFQDHLRASRPQRSVKTIAWDRWWVLLTIYGLWAAAWGLRRRSGLV